MKNKILFISSIVISVIVIIHLFVIGFMFPSEIILANFNDKISSITKVSLILYICLLMVFYFIASLPTYIKEKEINFNLFMAYFILEVVLNILPYFGI